MSMQRRRRERSGGFHTGEPFVIPNPWDPGSDGVAMQVYTRT